MATTTYKVTSRQAPGIGAQQEGQIDILHRSEG